MIYYNDEISLFKNIQIYVKSSIFVERNQKDKKIENVLKIFKRDKFFFNKFVKLYFNYLFFF